MLDDPELSSATLQRPDTTSGIGVAQSRNAAHAAGLSKDNKLLYPSRAAFKSVMPRRDPLALRSERAASKVFQDSTKRDPTLAGDANGLAPPSGRMNIALEENPLIVVIWIMKTARNAHLAM